MPHEWHLYVENFSERFWVSELINHQNESEHPACFSFRRNRYNSQAQPDGFDTPDVTVKITPHEDLVPKGIFKGYPDV
jgi:hypothetical protein